MTEPVEVKADYQSISAENQRLRRALYVMVAERNKAATKLTGVQNLGQQLQKKEQENVLLKEKVERLEGTLARAENRITQLSLKLGNGPHQAFSGSGIVTPGVAKKVLEALTRDNTRLKLALDHVTNKGSNGSDLAVVSFCFSVYIFVSRNTVGGSLTRTDLNNFTRAHSFLDVNVYVVVQFFLWFKCYFPVFFWYDGV